MVDDNYDELIGRALWEMEEPSLYLLAKDASKEIYRLTLLSVWRRNISVRFEFTNMTVRVSSVGTGREGDIEFKDTFVLKANESAELLNKINSLNFTSIPTANYKIGLGSGWIFEGARDGGWIFEGIKNGKYHVVISSGPHRNSEKRSLVRFASVCSYLLDEYYYMISNNIGIVEIEERTSRLSPGS